MRLWYRRPCIVKRGTMEETKRARHQCQCQERGRPMSKAKSQKGRNWSRPRRFRFKRPLRGRATVAVSEQRRPEWSFSREEESHHTADLMIEERLACHFKLVHLERILLLHYLSFICRLHFCVSPSPRSSISWKSLSRKRINNKASQGAAIETLMGPDQDQRTAMNYEDRLKAAMAFIRLCIEHGAGDSPRQGHVPSHTAASVTRPMCPVTLKPTLQPEVSEEPRVPRKLVMKRKVLRRRPDGEIQVTDESITSEPESSSLSDPGFEDPSQRIYNQNTKEDEESEECDPKSSPESETAYSWRTSEDNHSQGSQRESQCQSSPSEQDSIVTGHPKSFILPRSEQLNQNRMKTDRVARYLEYKHDWESLRLPGEDSRKSVRRNIREQMLYKTEFPPRPQLSYIPNNYLVPTEKKRSALRWGIRCDMANGVMPRSSYSS